MQSGIPDFLTVGVRVGNVLPVILPAHLISKRIHVLDKLCPAAAVLHALIHHTHQLKLPALAFDCRPVLTGVHTITFLLTVWENG